MAYGSIKTILLTDGRADLVREVIERPDGVQRLTTLEARLLGFLAAEMGRSVSQEELLEGVWGYSIDSLSRTVYTTIRRLRT